MPPKLEPITIDRNRRCYIVEVAYEYRGNIRLYVVLLQSDVPLMTFKALEVRNKFTGGKIEGTTLQHNLEVAAIRRLLQVMQDKTAPIREVEPTFDLAERVKRSMVLTLYTWDSDKDALGIVPKKHLSMLYSCMQKINDRIRELNIRARGEVREMPARYFQDIKGSELINLRGRYPEITDNQRNFMSSVLTRAYAWRSGKIPAKDREQIDKYLPGFELLLAHG